MKKLVLATALLAGGLLGLEDVSFAHGGQYRGPGDTVPPGGGGGGGGGGPASAGPAGPAAPSPTAPGVPGVARPGAPGAGAQRRGVTGGGAAAGPDLTLWTFWWEFNKEPYLNLKNAIFAGNVTTGSEGWFLGKGQQTQAKDSLRPTEEQIRQKVVPALIEALENETNNDIVTGALIALAKIGDEKSESGESRFEKIISKELTNSVQEIAETAAVALGILANDASVGTLASLVKDNEAGRKLVNAQEVNYRTRAFAAYGLALIGARTADEEIRREIVSHLHEVLETDDTKSFDLGTACIVAMGLVPLDTIEGAPVEDDGKKKKKKKDLQPPSTSRVAQMEYLLAYLNDDGNNFLVRAHAPTALARLLDPRNDEAAELPKELYDSYKETIVTDLLGRLKGNERNEVVQSCVVALGLIGDLDTDKVDADIRDAIANVVKDVSDQQARNYSMIAMAKIAGDKGNGDIEKGLDEASKFLLGQLSRGKSTVKPWAGLAIGVMCDEIANAEITTAVTESMKEALRSSLRDEKNDQEIGAYAVATGISKDIEAKDTLLDKLQRVGADEPRGYLAVALGLMNEREAIEPIQKIVKESKYRPELLKQAAISLGLLGDKELVGDLTVMLQEAKGLATQAAISSALGFIGDQRSIDPLVEMLQNQDLTDRARGFAAVALGIVADKELLPWNAKIGIDLNYRASTTTLNDQNGTGILNIL